MARELAPHTTIPTMHGGEVCVLEKLGGGGQGDVYRVRYGGEEKALKWYHIDKIYDLPKFMENLKRNVMNGAPTHDFLWPLDITDYHEGTFGYVMDLRPPEYAEAKEFLLGNVQFASYRRRVDACLNIVSAFRILHDLGYCYQDINAGNFFIHPETGKVLICDNDNVSINGMEMGVLGTLSYMAPEVVLKQTFPNTYSDRHSLAVLIFKMLLGPHPLEGSRSANTVLSDELKTTVFGLDPLFVLDPYDTRNAPDPTAQPGLSELWQIMPEHIKKLLTRAFSQDALHNPTHRPIEMDWIQALTRLRSEIITCECGNEVCSCNGHPVVCDACGRGVRATYVVRVGGAYLPVTKDMRIYRAQLGPVNPQHALDLVVYVTGSVTDPDVLGLRNMSNVSWQVYDARGKQLELGSNGVRMVEHGLRIDVPAYGKTASLRVEYNNLEYNNQ